MAIVGLIRFDRDSGCICVDRKSWFLRNRKSYFSDCIYSCVPEDKAETLGIEIIMGGVGYPPFHYEVSRKAKKDIKSYLNNNELNHYNLRVEPLSNIVLGAFRKAHRRKIDDRLNFLFGFTGDDFTDESYKKNGATYQIKQEKVRKRAQAIIDTQEKGHSYTLLIPDNEAGVIGISPEDGFHAYCIKEKDGVLSYYSCGFDCLGVGKYSGASEFANTMNKFTVEQRREGYGKEEGLLATISAVLEAWEHYSQIGGNINLILLDARGTTRADRLRQITDCESYLCIEAVKAYRGDILTKEDTIKIITAVVFDRLPWQKGEKIMFDKAKDINLLDRCLRGYKINGGREKITGGIEKIYSKNSRSKKINTDKEALVMSEAS